MQAEKGVNGDVGKKGDAHMLAVGVVRAVSDDLSSEGGRVATGNKVGG